MSEVQLLPPPATPSPPAGDAEIRERLQRIEDKVDKNAERSDKQHEETRRELAAHDRIIKATYDQVQEHNKMVLEHAKLHTEHARGIITAQEMSRTAQQSSSDLGVKLDTTVTAIAEHTKKADAARDTKIDTFIETVEKDAKKRATEAAASAIVEADRARRAERVIDLLDNVATVRNSKHMRNVLLLGGFAGSFTVAVLLKLAPHVFILKSAFAVLGLRVD